MSAGVEEPVEGHRTELVTNRLAELQKDIYIDHIMVYSIERDISNIKKERVRRFKVIELNKTPPSRITNKHGTL